jgi:single-stranded-DNA-specific exonuclease
MVVEHREILELCKQATQLIDENASAGKRIRLTSHLDADGLASASILSLFLRRLDANFSVRIVQQLDDEVVRRDIFAIPGDLYIFADLGSGQKPLVREFKPKNSEVIIIDHHQASEADDGHILEVNPNLLGMDGSTEACGATLSYLIASHDNVVNGKESALACVGAIGDRLDKGEKRSFKGLNEEVFRDVSKGGQVVRTLGLCLFGFETRPVVKCLEYTTDPLLPGLTGSESSSFAFMKKIGVEPVKDDHWRTLSELSESELQRLTSSLVKYLISKGVRAPVAESLIGYVYTIRYEERGSPLRDVREYASLLNACGRLNRPGIGLAIGMGDRRQHYAEAQTLLHDYRKKIGGYMDWLTSTPTAIQRKGSVTCLFGGSKIDEKIIGTVTSLALSSQMISEERPVLAFADSGNGKVKVSSRVASVLVEKGVNLGEALNTAAEAVGGFGGGHKAAAGALIPEGSEADFIDTVENTIDSQLRHSKAPSFESDPQAAV